MTRDRLSDEEVLARIEASDRANERIAHMERIGAGHVWEPCTWCGNGTPAPSNKSVWRLDGYRHPACHAAIKFLEAETW